MTAEPVRDIGVAAWMDPDAWMEAMNGPKWDAIVKEENERVTDFRKREDAKAVLKQFRQLPKSAAKTPGFVFQSGQVEIQPINGFFYNWRWKGEKKSHEVHDVIATNTICATTRDVGDGALEFQLEVFQKGRPAPIWTHKLVGPEVALVGDWCIYLGVANKLWYNEVWACHKQTGEGKRLLYKELNPHYNISLFRGEGNAVFVIREDAQDKEIYRLTTNLEFQQVKDVFTDDHKPPSIPHSIQWVSKHHNLLCTTTHGEKTLWRIHPRLPPVPLVRLPAGHFRLDPWAIHENRTNCILLLSTPTEGFQHVAVKGPKFQLLDASKGEFTMRRGNAKSKDGTIVHYVAVQQAGQNQPSHALVTGYGAYGLDTSTSYVGGRWNPLVRSGWLIVYCFIRGGGDHTKEWAKSARREGRTKTFDDFLACVQDVKTKYKLLAKDIVLYGRSAGGLLMGNSLARVPGGSLFGGVFAEVPYVDQLRTTTNPELPLTRMEANEFGDPASRLEDFLSVAQTSPVDLAHGLKTPKVFVYCKTAVNDTQVYAYESVKWIRALRQASPKGAPKLLSIALKEGHFTPPEKEEEQDLRDCAILHTLVA